MKTFISYAKDCKNRAGKIKKELDQFGFNCFLAHENIPPQTKWSEKIQDALENCDLFMPLLTAGFLESYYCQQETGFAYCRGIEILPVLIPKAPMGMISHIQGIRFNKNKFEASCWKIVRHIAKKPNIKRPVLDALIKWFGESNKYAIANERAELILNEFDFSPSQVRAIKKHIKGNSQIYQNWGARDYIFDFMDKYSNYFDRKFRDWYNSDRASRFHF